MSNKQIYQPLILTVRGEKPTVTERASAKYGDDDFDPKKNLMVGQWAFNVQDNLWFYRTKYSIQEIDFVKLIHAANSLSETIK